MKFATKQDRDEYIVSLLPTIEKIVMSQTDAVRSEPPFIPLAEKDSWTSEFTSWIIENEDVLNVFDDSRPIFPYLRKIFIGLFTSSSKYEIKTNGEDYLDMVDGGYISKSEYRQGLKTFNKIREVELTIEEVRKNFYTELIEKIIPFIERDLTEVHAKVFDCRLHAESFVDFARIIGVSTAEVNTADYELTRYLRRLKFCGRSYARWFSAQLQKIKDTGEYDPIEITLGEDLKAGDKEKILEKVREVRKTERDTYSGMLDHEISSQEIITFMGIHLSDYQNPFDVIKSWRKQGKILVKRVKGDPDTPNARYFYSRQSVLDLKKQLDLELQIKAIGKIASNIEKTIPSVVDDVLDTTGLKIEEKEVKSDQPRLEISDLDNLI